MGYRIFTVRTAINACDCTRGRGGGGGRGRGTDTERESARKVDSGKEIPCRSGESNLRQRPDGPVL